MSNPGNGRRVQRRRTLAPDARDHLNAFINNTSDISELLCWKYVSRWNISTTAMKTQYPGQGRHRLRNPDHKGRGLAKAELSIGCQNVNDRHYTKVAGGYWKTGPILISAK